MLLLFVVNTVKNSADITVSDSWQRQPTQQQCWNCQSWSSDHILLSHTDSWGVGLALLITLVLNSESNSKTGEDCCYQRQHGRQYDNPAAPIITSKQSFFSAPKHWNELIQKASLKSDARRLKSVPKSHTAVLTCCRQTGRLHVPTMQCHYTWFRKRVSVCQEGVCAACEWINVWAGEKERGNWKGVIVACERSRGAECKYELKKWV